MARKRHVARATKEEIEIEIPTMEWEQINGDMSPGAHGGTIATGDGRALELIKIQPTREYVGDEEAADVGFPFWTREAYYDVDDLRSGMDDALSFIGVSLEEFEEDFTPTQRALTLASALMDYGQGVDEGPAGWSDDINIPDGVKWMDGTVAGSEYLADEDDEFVRDVLLGDLDIDYEQFGPDEKEPTGGLRVAISRGHTVEITEWTDIEHANGDEQPEGEKILKQSLEVELDELFDPKGKHRGLYSRGSYSGDDRDITLVDVAKMDDDDREKAIVAAAISYMAYFGGEEEFVDAVGD